MAVIYVKFGYIGGKHSDPIYCRTRMEAAVLAANVAFALGPLFNQDAANHTQWLLNNRTNRIAWENADKSFFIEVVKQDKK